MAKTKHTTRWVIIGGGFGGVKAALGLMNKPGIHVTLISNTANFEYHGALYRTATGNSPLEVAIPLHEIFKRAHNVDVVLDQIASVHPKDHAVKSETGHAYEYDGLILALGNQVNYFGLEGMEDKTYCVSTVSSTIALRHEFITRFKSGKPTTVAIIGGGPTGVELAGEIVDFAQRVTTKFDKKFVAPRVVLIEGADRVLQAFDPILSARVYKRLQQKGVELRLSTKVNSCEVGKVCLSSGDIDADVIVWTAGSKLPHFYDANAKHFTFERGRVVVDEFLRAKGHENIFVIGDNALTKYSGMAQTAIHDAKYLSRNIVRFHGKKPTIPYEPHKPIYVVPVGKGWAAYSSDKHQYSGYRAWLIRRRADLWVFSNFEPYPKARRRWRHGMRSADY